MKKYTLITGAAGGLGKEFAILYAKEGCNLLLVDNNFEGLNEVKEELVKTFNNIEIDIIQKDLSNRDQLKEVYLYAKEKEYFVDNLINAAGFGDCTDFKDMDIDKQMKMVDVNCAALLYFTRVFLDDMLKNNEGHIINISSIAGFVPGPFMCTYHASKSFVLNLGESIAFELKGTNVKLLTLCPGPFLSKFVSNAHNDFTFKKIKPVTAKVVAEYGYKCSKKGKTLAIVSFKNKVTCFAPRFFSRKFVAKVSAKNIKKI
ncbi:MAG: SDR family NAD(P)-dependent oxidoreductase [Bacilli bacterium]